MFLFLLAQEPSEFMVENSSTVSVLVVLMGFATLVAFNIREKTNGNQSNFDGFLQL